jgi:hypothetical protein
MIAAIGDDIVLQIAFACGADEAEATEEFCILALTASVCLLLRHVTDICKTRGAYRNLSTVIKRNVDTEFETREMHQRLHHIFPASAKWTQCQWEYVDLPLAVDFVHERPLEVLPNDRVMHVPIQPEAVNESRVRKAEYRTCCRWQTPQDLISCVVLNLQLTPMRSRQSEFAKGRRDRFSEDVADDEFVLRMLWMWLIGPESVIEKDTRFLLPDLTLLNFYRRLVLDQEEFLLWRRYSGAGGHSGLLESLWEGAECIDVVNKESYFTLHALG